MRMVQTVISLAPTQTEIIAAIGCLSSLVGITENCDFPESIGDIARYGSWYAPDFRGVMEAAPDLVCTFGKHQEEMADSLREERLRVYHSDPPTVSAALQTITELSELLGRPDAASELLLKLNERLERIRQKIGRIAPSLRPTVFRIMNWEPLITVGPGAFQHDVIECAGGRNLMVDSQAPYVVCDPADVRKRNPQVIFTCEAFIVEALRNDPQWSLVDAVRNDRLYVFDCGLTCRSGPRIVDMVEGLADALHPESTSIDTR